jgi:probable HAF family extracellular repeat protein
MKLRLAELLTIGSVVGAVSSLAQTYTVQDLGTAPGTILSRGTGLNDLGEASGTSDYDGYFATLFSSGQATELSSLLPGDHTYAYGIDNSGVIVGFEQISNTGPSHALVWNKGTVQDITAWSVFPGGATAMLIGKKSGVVVGVGTTSNGDSHMFLYENGQTVDLGMTTSPASPVAINDSGEILVDYQISTSSNVPAIYFNGTFTLINAPANATVTAYDINDNGVVAGGIYYKTNALGPHAGLYSNGAWTDLGMLSGAGRGTIAWSINSAGQVLGMAAYNPVYKPDIGVRTVPCIFKNGVWVDLNTLISSNSTFYRALSRPVAINDAGQILVNTKNPQTMNGYRDAVLLTPK